MQKTITLNTYKNPNKIIYREWKIWGDLQDEQGGKWHGENKGVKNGLGLPYKL